ncbi:MAG: DNA polymerase III subunit chi, partial [Pseudomonadota bacterium]
MTEVMFYHLERQSLEQVLPKLLEKTLERGWTAVVQAGFKERVDALND